VDRWLEPLALLHGPAAFQAVGSGHALPLHGGTSAFCLVRRIAEGRDLGVMPVTAVPEGWHDLLDQLTRRPPVFAGLPHDRTLVMGIVNVTPDSFSDGGRHLAPEDAIAAGHAMLEAGADLLDIGGESTRPGAPPVSPEEEIRRVIPVVRELAKAAPVSIDTRHAATMLAALEAGAEIVNDISALRFDPEATRVVARNEVPVILMHMPVLDPRRMAEHAQYEDVVLEVARFLRERVALMGRIGIPASRIAIDPGIGFGKTAAHNWKILQRLPLLLGIGCPLVMALSRKRFLGPDIAADQRGPASVIANLASVHRGAAIIRVHDVAETLAALNIWKAVTDGGMEEPDQGD
jgi:dihydropteroate synthase